MGTLGVTNLPKSSPLVGLTAAHIASLSHNSGTNIYAYGITSDRHQKNVNKLLDKLGVRGIYTSLSSP